MTTPARYQLDGQPMFAKHVAREHGWPVKLVMAAMRSAAPPTTLLDLKAWIVRHRATFHRAPPRIRTTSRRWNGSNPAEATPLNKSGTIVHHPAAR